ncbi:MAG: hypothetical protein H8E85_03060 [Candidatus Marinimicrobia bacterium]|nr:hypothetical protein [Candidatus Neomarinimicrobiota bacterium]
MNPKSKITFTDTIRAYLDMPDMEFVNNSTFERANENRLYFEIALSFSMVFSGRILADYVVANILGFILSTAVAFFLLYRYRNLNNGDKQIELKGVLKLGDE